MKYSHRALFIASVVASSLLAPVIVFASDVVSYDQSKFSAAVIDASNSLSFGTSTLSDERTVSLAEPSVVRVIHHVTGTATISAFNFDLKNFHIVPSKTKQKPLEIPLDEYMWGSGFIIDQSGIIVTNSHVISQNTIKYKILAPLFLYMLEKDAGKLSKAQQEKFAGTDPKVLEQKGIDMFKELIDSQEFDLTDEIVIANPNGETQSIKNALASGTPATVLKINENYIFDGRDVAVLKVEKNNLPALNIGSASDVRVGSPVYVFGYPGNAEVSDTMDVEPTFTKGIINAIKQSEKGDFKIIQSDAKISQGSSGGPLLDSHGVVRGIITFQTNPLGQGGDNFAFAIPSEVIISELPEGVISNEKNYSTLLRTGWKYLDVSECKKANKEFELAIKMETLTNPVGKFVQPYIDTCNTMLAAGKSLDDLPKLSFFSKLNFNIWWVVMPTVFIILVIFLVALLSIFKKVQTDEMTVDTLREDIKHVTEVSNNSSAPLKSEIESIKSELHDFEVEQKSVNAPLITDVSELKHDVAIIEEEQKRISSSIAKTSQLTQPLINSSQLVSAVSEPTKVSQPQAQVQSSVSEVASVASVQAVTQSVNSSNPQTQKNVFTLNQVNPEPVKSTINPQLLAYITQARSSGLSNESIRTALLTVGWKAVDVEQALGEQ